MGEAGLRMGEHSVWGTLPEVQWGAERRERGALSFGVQYSPSPLHGGTLKGALMWAVPAQLCLFLAVGAWTNDLI